MLSAIITSQNCRPRARSITVTGLADRRANISIEVKTADPTRKSQSANIRET